MANRLELHAGLADPAESAARVQNGYVRSGTGGLARPLLDLKNPSVSCENVPTGAREWTRVPHSSFPRNEGVPVRVRASAFAHLQGFLALQEGLGEGVKGLPEVYLVECSRRKRPFCRLFSSSETSARVSSPVTSSSLESRLNASAAVKESRSRVGFRDRLIRQRQRQRARLGKRRGGSVAAITVARKLAEACWWMLTATNSLLRQAPGSP
jgi:hypothetical protein